MPPGDGRRGAGGAAPLDMEGKRLQLQGSGMKAILDSQYRRGVNEHSKPIVAYEACEVCRLRRAVHGVLYVPNGRKEACRSCSGVLQEVLEAVGKPVVLVELPQHYRKPRKRKADPDDDGPVGCYELRKARRKKV